MLFRSNTRPGFKKSSANGVGSTWQELRGGKLKPKCTAAITERENTLPVRVSPDTGTVAPGHSELRRNGRGPGRAGSGAASEAPARAGLLEDKEAPGSKKSGTGKDTPGRVLSGTGRHEPSRELLRRGSREPGRKKSDANRAMSMQQGLRGSGNEANCTDLEAGASAPGQARLWTDREGPEHAESSAKAASSTQARPAAIIEKPRQIPLLEDEERPGFRRSKAESVRPGLLELRANGGKPGFRRSRTDKLEPDRPLPHKKGMKPSRVGDLVDRFGPKCKGSKASSAAPKYPMLLGDGGGPKCRKSDADKRSPRLDLEDANGVGPKRVTCRIERFGSESRKIRCWRYQAQAAVALWRQKCTEACHVRKQ